MRLVHVAVRAEGPTRVLCFSDSRGAALPGDEEETITKATAKLRGLQKHLQVSAATQAPNLCYPGGPSRNGSPYNALQEAIHRPGMGNNQVVSAQRRIAP